MTARIAADTRRTRIVATIGPTSDSPERIDALLAAGVDVARVNCAHGTPKSRCAVIETLRARAAAKKQPLAILADLAGPKLRIGSFAAGPVELEEGALFTLTTTAVSGDVTRVSVEYPDLPGDVDVGTAIHLNDGLVRLEVVAVSPREVRTRVVVGGPLDDRKGVSVPGGGARMPALTAQDRSDLEALRDMEVDYVGLSFVRSEDDIRLLRRSLDDLEMGAGIVAKIEKAQAVDRIEEIAAEADAVMVARGDLGVECPIEDVPFLQKRILAVCRRAGKPAITATQMLESMVHAPVPTRAEANDVANAVLDGTDAVMLSAETANGWHPVVAVQTMARIVLRADGFAASQAPPGIAPSMPLDTADAASRSACLAAESVQARAIVALTTGGATARRIARWRPSQPIFAVTGDEAARRMLSLVWGVTVVRVDDLGDDFEDACRRVAPQLRDAFGLAAGDRVVFTAGLPFGGGSSTNTVRIGTV